MTYDKAIEFVLKHEGKRFVESSGHLSLLGINSRFWPAEVAAMEGMTDGQQREYAEGFYKKHYWDSSWDEFPQVLATAALDSAVNCGFVRTKRWLEMAGNDILKFLSIRMEAYTYMKEWDMYGRGWIHRMADLMKGGT